MGFISMLTSSALLQTFIIANTIRSLVAYSILQSGLKISPGMVTLQSEAAKLVLAIVLARRNRVLSSAYDLKASLFFAIPACAYLINNLVYFAALRLSSPTLVHVVMTAKVPLTALVHHVVIRRQRNLYAWTSLFFMCLSLVLYATPTEAITHWVSSVNIFFGFADPESLEAIGATANNSGMMGAVLAFLIAVVSAAAGIYTELLLKQRVDFWVAQIWLYFYGTVFAAFSLLCWDGSKGTTTPEGSAGFALFCNVALTLTTTVTGLIIANILRKRDNLVKLVGSSACITTILFTQAVIFPQLRSKSLSFKSVLSVGLIAITSWTYNHYIRGERESNINPRTQDALDREIEQLLKNREDDDEKVEPSRSSVLDYVTDSEDIPLAQPTALRVTVAVLVAITFALMVQDGHDIYNNTS